MHFLINVTFRMLLNMHQFLKLRLRGFICQGQLTIRTTQNQKLDGMLISNYGSSRKYFND